MTTPTTETIEQTIALFNHRKVLLINDITMSMKVSARTVYRYLKQYYTLQNIPEFDQNGLWKYENICFSKFGNMVSTVKKIVENSPSGMTMNQLNTLLECTLESILPNMIYNNLLFRQKYNGLYMYFATKPELRNAQLEQLSRVVFEITPAISCETAIKILVYRIQHPDMEFQKFVKQLHRCGVKCDTGQIQTFFEFHGIKKKR
jgi:hypothetical protein